MSRGRKRRKRFLNTANKPREIPKEWKEVDEEKEYQEAFSKFMDFLHTKPDIEICTTEPLCRKYYRKPYLKFHINILFDGAKDYTTYLTAKRLLLNILEYRQTTTDEDDLFDDNIDSDVYATGVDINGEFYNKMKDKFNNLFCQTPHVLYTKGTYYGIDSYNAG